MNATSDQMNLPESDDRNARRRNRTRACLLDAARHVLARLGYQAATVADITRAADVGVGTFYLHFRDKDALLRTLLEEGLQELRVEIGAVVAPLPLARSIPAAIRALCDALYAHRDIMRIAYTSGSFIDLTRRGQELLAGYFQKTIVAAQAQGLVGAEIDAPLVANLISGMILQGALWWSDHPAPSPAHMAEQIIRLLRGGLPPALFAE
jgi:AcrR family transcriptional regulator